MKCLLGHKLVISKYRPSCLKVTFKGNICSIIKLLTIFCIVFMLLLIVINSKKYINPTIQTSFSE